MPRVLRQEVLPECFTSEDKNIFLDYLMTHSFLLNLRARLACFAQAITALKTWWFELRRRLVVTLLLSSEGLGRFAGVNPGGGVYSNLTASRIVLRRGVLREVSSIDRPARGGLRSRPQRVCIQACQG